LLEVLPNRLTGDVLEQLRLSKQSLVLNLPSESFHGHISQLDCILILYSCVKVELGSRAGDLKQMLIDLLEDPHEIRRICIMGRNCTLDKLSDDVECSVPLEKHIAEGTTELHHCNHAPSVPSISSSAI
jgi:magnesium transporter